MLDRCCSCYTLKTEWVSAIDRLLRMLLVLLLYFLGLKSDIVHNFEEEQRQLFFLGLPTVAEILGRLASSASSSTIFASISTGGVSVVG